MIPSPELPAHDLGRVVEALERHGVEYLLIGGVAAIGYGATRQTEDADCVVRRTRANLERVAAALRDLNARLRVAGMSDEAARALPIRVDSTLLDRAGMTTWMTDAGPFDVLAGLEAIDDRLKSYDELIGRSTLLEGDGFVIRAAGLDDNEQRELLGRVLEARVTPFLKRRWFVTYCLETRRTAGRARIQASGRTARSTGRSGSGPRPPSRHTRRQQPPNGDGGCA